MDGQEDQLDNRKPKAFAVRLPAALLQQVNLTSTITLPKGSTEDNGLFQVTALEQQNVVTRQEIIPETHIYQVAADTLDHVGTATHRVTLSTPVLELGKRARERLNETRSKRREIVVLDQPLPLPPTAKTTTRTKPAAATTKAAPVAAPVAAAPAVHEKSSVVRLHGVPESCTPEMIRRFFSGLSPERVLILPWTNHRFSVWEETEDDERILVKFASAPIAVTAVQRSNEYLRSEGGAKHRIQVTLVAPKATGNYLLQNLAIDGVAGESLAATREATEEASLPLVLTLVWALAAGDLKLLNSSESSHPWVGQSYWQSRNLAELQEDHKGLYRDLDSIKQHGAILELQAGDLQHVVPSDAVVRLYRVARQRLEEESLVVENLMLMMRHEERRAPPSLS